MQRASDAAAILAILVGSVGSLTLTARVVGNRGPDQAVEVDVPNAPQRPDGAIRIPLPPVEHREIRIQPGELRVMHVPLLRREAVVIGTSDWIKAPRTDLRGGVTVEFGEVPAPDLLMDAKEQTRDQKRSRRHKRVKRQKRRRPSGP